MRKLYALLGTLAVAAVLSTVPLTPTLTTGLEVSRQHEAVFGWMEGIPPPDTPNALPSLKPSVCPGRGLFIAALDAAIANYPGQRFALRNGALVIKRA
jgi:hypothetical protein